MKAVLWCLGAVIAWAVLRDDFRQLGIRLLPFDVNWWWVLAGTLIAAVMIIGLFAIKDECKGDNQHEI